MLRPVLGLALCAGFAVPLAGPAVAAGATGPAVTTGPAGPSGAAPTAPSAHAAGPPQSASRAAALPLGAADLPEKRTPTALAPGVTRTLIVRGNKNAKASRINVTTAGPWRVNVVTIDPKRSRHTLSATAGTTLMAPDTTSHIGIWAGAKVAMNASFFNYGGPAAYRGDPVGLTVSRGTVTSEQTGTTAEQNVLIDRNRLRMGRYLWRGYVEDTTTGKRRTLAGVNRVPRVPAACLTDDARACADSTGELVRFSPHFAAATPTGKGAEAVYGRDGCLVRVANTRGTKLTPAQFSIQGTGDRAAQILRGSRDACVTLDESVRTADGEKVALGRNTYGVTGRYRLVRDGRIIENRGTASMFKRHPRSIIGRTAAGTVMLVTIDGRSVSGVGVTLVEAARVARGLGMVDAVNLDGGGSTTLAIDGKIVNRVSGARERLVSDAIVLTR